MAEAINIDPWVATIIFQVITCFFIQSFCTTRQVFITHNRHLKKQRRVPHVKFKRRPTSIHDKQGLTQFHNKVDCCVGRWRRFASSRPFPRIVALTATASPEEMLTPNTARFDTDSFKVCIDTGASCSMSGDMSHFATLVPVNYQVSGIGEKGLQAKGKGMLVFKIEDDKGQVDEIRLQDSLYVPGLPCPLLVPRHWSEQAGDNGTCAIFGNKSCKLLWKQGRHCKTIRYNDTTKTPTFFTAAGTKTYRAFVALFEANEASVPYQQVLRFPGQDLLDQGDEATFDPAEFAAEEDLNLKRNKQQLGSQPQEAEAENLTQQDLLHFDVAAQCPFHPQGHHTWGECTLYS